MRNSRILPPLIMHPILIPALLVIRVRQARVQHLGLVQQLVVEAERLLVFGKGRLGCWSHLLFEFEFIVVV